VQSIDAQIPPPAGDLNSPVAEATGRGRFVGLCVDVGGSRDLEYPDSLSSNLDFLTGDLHAQADGEKAIDSTGTEDYADSAYYFIDAPKATPFVHSWGRVDHSSASPPGQISFCRWHVLGGEIDFQKRFLFTRELTHHDPANIAYQHSVAFLYMQP
jgi:hypothetical protein